MSLESVKAWLEIVWRGMALCGCAAVVVLAWAIGNCARAWRGRR